MSVFHGLQVIVVAIVAKAAFTFGRATVKGWWDCIIALAAAGYLISGGNPVVAILAGAVVGLLVYRRTSPYGETAQHSDSSSLRSITRQALVVILVGAALLAALLLMNRRLFDLAALMLKVDILAFGGGFASVPVMLHSVAEVNHWMSTRTFMDGIAMGQVTPGPIVITATFVGYQVAGIFGAVVATAAVFFPSFVILVLIVPRFDRLKRNPRFQMAMREILASFVGLLLSVTVRFAIAVPWSPASVVIGCAALIALMLDVGVPWVVLPGAVLSAFLLR
jgi:chromate transporter